MAVVPGSTLATCYRRIRGRPVERNDFGRDWIVGSETRQGIDRRFARIVRLLFIEGIGMRRTVVRVAVSTAAMLASVVVSGMPANAGEGLEYNRDIRPILFENCFACHGPDSASRKAGLRLDQRDAAVQVGAIEPGKPDESELIRRIFSAKRDEMMPPPLTRRS